MLVTVTARLVRSHGSDEVALPGSGRIEYRPESHGIWEGALRGQETVTAMIVEGDAEEVELTPGPWRARVVPDHGAAWDSWLIELTEGMPEPVDLAALAPVIVIDGEKWAAGPAGASVTDAVDNGDQTVSFVLSDGTVTDSVEIPAGPPGVGIESISDPDADSRVTVTYTDGSTSTVQAVRGAPGGDGHSPVITWDSTALVVDGEPGPDLAGEPGAASTVPGPANTLTIGEVTTVAPGDPASATITGEAPAQTLSLALPRGIQGEPGPALPETGWIGCTMINGWTAATWRPGVAVKRIGNMVHMRVESLDGAESTSNRVASLPAGFYDAEPIDFLAYLNLSIGGASIVDGELRVWPELASTASRPVPQYISWPVFTAAFPA